MSGTVTHLTVDDALLSREPDWELIAESIPHIAWVKTPDGAAEYLNKMGAEFFGLGAEETYGWSWLSLVHPDDAAIARPTWERAIRKKAPYHADYRMRASDGEYHWMASRALPVKAHDGTILKWLGTLTEIDENKRLEDELRRAERQAAESLTLLETLQSKAPVGFGFVDRDFRFVRVNQTLAAINGAPLREHLGRRVAQVVPSLWPQIEPLYRRVLSTGQPVVNFELTGETAIDPGVLHNWLASFYPVRIGTEIIGIGVVVIDITERTRAEEFRSVVMDNMDEGLYVLDKDGLLTYMNRAASRMLGWTIEELRGKLMHDVVHFQRADGTRVPASECPLINVRTEGGVLRVGDDTFTRKDGSMIPVAFSSAPLRIGENVEGEVIVFRDTTYEKQQEAATRRELAELSWVGRIRDALDENRLTLYSQPIVSLTGGEPQEELLLRMIGTAGEIILPRTFLPAAERYGLIGEIDSWVVTEAIRIAATGRRVEANLSAVSIGSLDLLPLIKRELRRTGADPANVIFEITETALIQDMETAEAFARGVADLGCRLALDDFGTGFGGFTYLKKLPISFLKIDVEFVRDLPKSPANLHVVRAVVGLARAFGLQTIAEGVEDQYTADLLRDEGVDFGQGFHLGRPEPDHLP